ncbi:MAG: hypothetical protein NVSMB48_12090 [Marmoricola sp.]
MPDRDTYPEVQYLSIGETARAFGVTVETIRRWDAQGAITSIRTPGNQRRYALTEIERVKQERAA